MSNNYGYLKSPNDLRDYHLNKTYMAVDLPDTFEVPHSSIKNQGNVGACVAFSIVEILESKLVGNYYSTNWIYGYRPRGYSTTRGMYPSEALKTVKQTGYVYYNTLPGNREVPHVIEIVNSRLDELTEEASHKKIVSYARLKSIYDIKEAIYLLKSPVLVCINIDEKGLKLDPNGVAYVPETPDGGHAVICYGWNETGFLIQNSWGVTWGKKGVFILPYEYEITEAWSINVGDEDTYDIITPPKYFVLREFAMLFVKLFNKLFVRN